MTATTDRAPASKKMRYQQCIGLAIEYEMMRDERVFAMGQDLTTLGGQFGLSRGLIDKFGHNRVRDTGIVETFIVGAACGAAIGGVDGSGHRRRVVPASEWSGDQLDPSGRGWLQVRVHQGD